MPERAHFKIDLQGHAGHTLTAWSDDAHGTVCAECSCGVKVAVARLALTVDHDALTKALVAAPPPEPVPSTPAQRRFRKVAKEVFR